MREPEFKGKESQTRTQWLLIFTLKEVDGMETEKTIVL